MKAKLTILAVLLCLFGCNNENIGSPESVAEKYLSELSSDLSALGFYNAREHDSRSFALMENEQADSIIRDGKIPTMPELFDKYFQDDKMFYRWELMDISNDTIDVYSVWDFTHNSGTIERKAILDIYKKEGGEYDHQTLCKITDVAAVILQFRDLPMYILRYKIDGQHIDFAGDKYSIATLKIVKFPEKGYKVASFTWEE